MRRIAAWGAWAMLFLASTAVALPGPLTTSFTAHPAIVINGDADFTAANGVRGGSGTPSDPYVISGWHFLAATGITIRGTTKSYLIEENVFESNVGVRIESGDATSVVSHNQFSVRGTGVAVYDASVVVRDNAFIGFMQGTGLRTGVTLYASNAQVDNNAFVWIQKGIVAELGSPVITCNDIHDDVVIFGISLLYTSNATVSCNVITQCDSGIVATTTIGTVIANNTIVGCGGIEVTLSKDVRIENNSVRGSAGVGIWVDTTSGTVHDNLVIDGKTDGISTRLSTVVIARNNASNNLRAGIRLGLSPTDVEANVLLRNGVGIAVQSGSVPHLRANVMSNNTVGLDLPYGSRQAVVHMSANLVNGVSIDGALDASERVYFYKEANVTLVGQLRDSGFSAGYYGALTAQGNVVLWEVDTATIDATVISHAAVGVGAVNSFNVVVNGSQIVQAGIGVHGVAWPVSEPVPTCVVSVKDTNITIPVDPPATVGVKLEACLGLVLRTQMSLMDTGLVVDGASSVTMVNSTITQTRLGLDVAGVADGVNLTGNVVAGNTYGARLRGTVGVVAENRFEANAKYAVRLESGASIKLERNLVRANGEGIIDVQPCAGSATCSSVTSRDNLFTLNTGDGLRLNGTSTLRGDRFLANLGTGAKLAGATLLGVNASGNGGDGAVVGGTFRVEDSVFDDNAFHGLRASGVGHVEDSRFTGNDGAGLRVSVTSLTVTRADLSRNLDGILADEVVAPAVGDAISVPSLLGMVARPGTTPDAVRVHLSVIEANQRDGIRATGAAVNATHNWWGRATGPSVSVLDTVGAFQNGVSPTVRFVPFWTDAAMTTTGPVQGI